MSRRSALFYAENAGGESESVIVTAPSFVSFVVHGASAVGIRGTDTGALTGWSRLWGILSAWAGDISSSYLVISSLTMPGATTDVEMSDGGVVSGGARVSTVRVEHEGESYLSTVRPAVTSSSLFNSGTTMRQGVDSYIAAHPGVTVRRWRVS